MIQDISAHVIFMFLMIAWISAHKNTYWQALHKLCSIEENTTVVQWPFTYSKMEEGKELAGLSSLGGLVWVVLSGWSSLGGLVWMV